jgi:hypothetical protein
MLQIIVILLSGSVGLSHHPRQAADGSSVAHPHVEPAVLRYVHTTGGCRPAGTVPHAGSGAAWPAGGCSPLAGATPLFVF